ncbi:TrmH family RNA methyltransferase [Xanthovirga aplysinae]|uniref:TrmH family RNA methyltransferase n=1 Tax=Xanthovirga aplysinae TaxID=2529853 RepID=UPI0012BBBE96|nr:RNA methyltransferase [Xanthovirga aplysinae]MTI29989.1 RNA methyltransferase [Xanthovirga aplysinae]
MISKSIVKFIKSLQIKKYRKQEQAFLVEGAKSVTEVIQSDYRIKKLLATEPFLQENQDILAHKSFEILPVNEKELSTLGTFKSNNAAMAITEMKPNIVLTVTGKEYGLVLDDVRDPGNLGTIIRIADWYGIKKIICSNTCADVYNPKTISASMGSFCRIEVFFTDLVDYLSKADCPVFGAFLEGKNVHQTQFSKRGLILMGNESKGISANLEPLVNHKISIPRFGEAESLNVGVATAVICDNLRREFPIN